MSLYEKTMQSPVGTLRLVASDKGLRAVLWEKDEPGRVVFDSEPVKDAKHPILREAEAQLNEYFALQRKVFDVPLDMKGTSFQRMAWKELQKIPMGTTISYYDQAVKIGNANKARAVGSANNRNPISIIVPCHRVVGKNGALTGFAGGMRAKQFLIDLEKKQSVGGSPFTAKKPTLNRKQLAIKKANAKAAAKVKEKAQAKAKPKTVAKPVAKPSAKPASSAAKAVKKL